MLSDEPVIHGGNLERAAHLFGTPVAGWQDLSTGISPWSYPVENMPTAVWQRLPESDSHLCQVAAGYYSVTAEDLVPVPGSQWAIGVLPELLLPASVAVPAVGYQEHSRCWAAAGHRVVSYRSYDELNAQVSAGLVQYLVIINPNNPTAEICTSETIRQLCEQLPTPGRVVVDEAFMDAIPSESACPLLSACPSLIVLRSLGKFFGLAGMRLGFVITHDARLRYRLTQKLRPWGVSHPALWLGAEALADSAWQGAQRVRIREAEARQLALLKKLPGAEHLNVVSAGLFVTLTGDNKQLYALYTAFAKAGLLLRWCEHTDTLAWLRMGLPDDDGARLAQVLQKIYRTEKINVR